MEIYNLKDFKKDSADVEPDGSAAEFRITDVKQAVKNENRANIFVNGKYSFSLDIAQLVDFKIKIGQVFSESDLEKLKNASEFGKLYQRMLEWVLMRPRSVREAKDHLKIITGRSKSEYIKKDPDLKNDILERLVSRGYLDDAKFAAYYVENRFTKKGISKKRLTLELYKKGVDKTIVDEVIGQNVRNDEEEIQKIIMRKRARYDNEKLTNYLVRQGFDFELVRSLVRASSETDSQN